MPVIHKTYNSGKYTISPSFVGLVLSFHAWEDRVSSDRAMIDSGNRISVVVWDEARGMPVTHIYGDSCPEVVVDAPPEIVEKAVLFSQTMVWAKGIIREIRERLKAAKEIKEGMQVEVFKGRKAPKGMYTITQVGENDFGKYFHIKDGDGTIHRYINQDNCKVQFPEVNLKDIPRSHIWAEAAKSYQYDYKYCLVPLIDWMFEDGDPRAPYFRAWVCTPDHIINGR